MPDFNNTLFGLDVRVYIDEEGTIEEVSTLDDVYFEIDNIRIASTKLVTKGGLTHDVTSVLTLEDHFADEIHEALEEHRREVRDFRSARGRDRL